MLLTEITIRISGDGPEDVLNSLLDKLEEIDFASLIRSKIENIPNLENLEIQVIE